MGNCLAIDGWIDHGVSLMRRRSLWQALVKQIPQRRRHRASIRLAKLLRRPVPSIVNGCRLELDLTENIQRAMFLGEYEPEQTGWTRECLRAGDVVIDVGANFGYHTFLASSLVGPTGAVFAFEPSPLASATLTAGVRRNNLANVTITQAAVGNEAGRAALFGEESDDLHSPSLVQMHSGLKSVDVPILRLDDFEPLKDDDTMIRLMKIDVEGYEPDVLTGARGMLQEGRVENIFCEFNSGWLERNDSTIMQLKDRFAALGYHIYRQTPFRQGLKGHQGEPYDMVDIWYRWERPNTPS